MSLDEQWNIKYEALLSYCREHGTGNVPQKFKWNHHDGSVLNLGKWVYTQRFEKKKGLLRQDKVDKLQSLANEGLFDWEPSLEEAKKWELKFEALMQYARQNGHCNLPKGTEISLSDGSKCNLYNWLVHELFLRRKGKMKPEREQLFYSQLIAPGYLQWDKKHDSDEAAWDLKFKCLLAFANAHNGNYNVPESYKYIDAQGNEVKLGIWLSYQRAEKRKGKLRKDREEKLNRLVERGFLWDPNAKSGRGMNSWDRKFEAMLQYEREFGTCNVPDGYRTYIMDGKLVKLGRWLSKQRSAKKYGKLDEYRLARLQALVDEKRLLWEFSLTEFNAQTWEEKYNLLVAYGNIHGTCELPRNAIIVSTNDQGKSKEYRLGEWLYYQKSAKKYMKLKLNREEKLQQLVNEGKLSWDVEVSSIPTTHLPFKHAENPYPTDSALKESYHAQNENETSSARYFPEQTSESQSEHLYEQQAEIQPFSQNLQQSQSLATAGNANPYISIAYGSSLGYHDEEDDSSSSDDDDDDEDDDDNNAHTNSLQHESIKPSNTLLMNDNAHQSFALGMDTPSQSHRLSADDPGSVPVHIVYGASGNRDSQLILHDDDQQFQSAGMYLPNNPAMFSSFAIGDTQQYSQQIIDALPADDDKDDDVISFAKMPWDNSSAIGDNTHGRKTKRQRLKD